MSEKLISYNNLSEYDEKIKTYIENHGGDSIDDTTVSTESTWSSSKIDSTKQNKLSAEQLNAVNSGITSTKVNTYDGYASQISGKYTKPSTGIPASDLASGVIPTTLPASDVKSWAKADTKPTYTASEVGALASTTTHLSGDIATSQKGVANGVATLDANGLVPSSQLPSYVDDVLEYSAKTSFPTTGETGKIYVDTSKNLTYRWSGTAYVEISPSIALGETSSTAYAGDKGKANAEAISELQTNLNNLKHSPNGGYNLIPFPYYDGMSKVNNGITYVVNADGSVTANGTATNASFFEIISIKDFPKLKNGTKYRLTGCPSGGSGASDNSYQIKGRNPGGTYDIGNGWEFTYSDTISDYNITIRIGKNTVCNNLTFKPMLTEVNADGTYPTEYERWIPSVQGLEDKKQDALETQTAYTSKGTSKKVPQITTNALGQVTDITEVDIEGGADEVFLTKAEYDALPESKLTDDKWYNITDEDGEAASMLNDNKVGKSSTWSSQKINAELTSLGESVAEGKSSIASALTTAGVTTASDATFEVLSNNVAEVYNNVINTQSTVTGSWMGATYTATASDGYKGGNVSTSLTTKTVTNDWFLTEFNKALKYSKGMMRIPRYKNGDKWYISGSDDELTFAAPKSPYYSGIVHTKKTTSTEETIDIPRRDSYGFILLTIGGFDDTSISFSLNNNGYYRQIWNNGNTSMTVNSGKYEKIYQYLISNCGSSSKIGTLTVRGIGGYFYSVINIVEFENRTYSQLP